MAGADIYEYLAGILDQTDKTVSATSPTRETLDFTASGTDSLDSANILFTDTAASLPARNMACGDVYNTEQAVSRIIMLYSTDRAGFYELSKRQNEVRRARLKHKAALYETLMREANAALDEYGVTS